MKNNNIKKWSLVWLFLKIYTPFIVMLLAFLFFGIVLFSKSYIYFLCFIGLSMFFISRELYEKPRLAISNIERKFVKVDRHGKNAKLYKILNDVSPEKLKNKIDIYLIPNKNIFFAVSVGSIFFPKLIVISEAMLDRFNDHQMECVFAHEVGHIKYMTTTFLSIFCLFFGSSFFSIIVLFINLFLFLLSFNFLVAVFSFVVFILFCIFFQSFEKLFLFFLSRQHEYLADSFVLNFREPGDFFAVLTQLIPPEQLVFALSYRSTYETHPNITERLLFLNKIRKF